LAFLVVFADCREGALQCYNASVLEHFDFQSLLPDVFNNNQIIDELIVAKIQRGGND
jgi:hypothetical protein